MSGAGLSRAGGLSSYCGKVCSRGFWHPIRRLLCLTGLRTKLQPGDETLILRWRRLFRAAES